jgi:hypothetical protein
MFQLTIEEMHQDNKNHNHQDCNQSQTDVLHIISNLSSQSNESSNIILRAVAQGLSKGISEGIASGNIALSFQDIVSLASMFKPKEDIPMRLIDTLVPQNVICSNASISHSKSSSIETLATSNSLHSFGKPSSVHVADVTVEKIPAYEPKAYLRVSGTADDRNVEARSLPNATREGSELESDVTNARKRSNEFIDINDEDDVHQINCRTRYELTYIDDVNDATTKDANAIKSDSGIFEYISKFCGKLPEAVMCSHDKQIKSNGKFTSSRYRMTSHIT